MSAYLLKESDSSQNQPLELASPRMVVSGGLCSPTDISPNPKLGREARSQRVVLVTVISVACTLALKNNLQF